MKTKAIIVPKQGEVAFEEQELKALGTHDILVECKTSVISAGTERAFILNMEGVNAKYPLKGLGYASAGIVREVGEGVVDFKPGDRVATKMSHRSFGIINEKLAVHIADNVTFEQAAFVTLGAICIQGVRKAQIELGEATIVIGQGLIGQLSCQLSRINGAYPTIAADIIDGKINVAVECGADIGVNTMNQNWQEDLKQLMGGKSPAVVIESTGAQSPISTAFDVAAKYGKVVLLGSTRGSATIDFYSQVHKKGLKILGAHISTIPSEESYPNYWTYNANMNCIADMLKTGRMVTAPLVSKRVELSNALDAFYEMLSPECPHLAMVINW